MWSAGHCVPPLLLKGSYIRVDRTCIKKGTVNTVPELV